MEKVSLGLKDRVRPEMKVWNDGREMSLFDALCRWATELLADNEHLYLRSQDLSLLKNLVSAHAWVKPIYNHADGWLCGKIELEVDPHAPLGLPNYVYGSGDELLNQLELAEQINVWLEPIKLNVLSPDVFVYLGGDDGAMTLKEASELIRSRLEDIHRTHDCLNAHRPSFEDPLGLYDDLALDLEAAADYFEANPDGDEN